MTLRWTSKDKILYLLIKYLLPFLEKFVLERTRKKVFKKMMRYVQRKNKTLQKKRYFTLSLWVNKNYSAAQLIFNSAMPFKSKPKPFHFILSKRNNFL